MNATLWTGCGRGRCSIKRDGALLRESQANNSGGLGRDGRLVWGGHCFRHQWRPLSRVSHMALE